MADLSRIADLVRALLPAAQEAKQANVDRIRNASNGSREAEIAARRAVISAEMATIATDRTAAQATSSAMLAEILDPGGLDDQIAAAEDELADLLTAQPDGQLVAERDALTPIHSLYAP